MLTGTGNSTFATACAALFQQTHPATIQKLFVTHQCPCQFFLTQKALMFSLSNERVRWPLPRRQRTSGMIGMTIFNKSVMIGAVQTWAGRCIGNRRHAETYFETHTNGKYVDQHNSHLSSCHVKENHERRAAFHCEQHRRAG